MAEIGFENGRNSNFQGLVTLTLTLDPPIRHTVVHRSSTSIYIPNFIQIKETVCGRTDVWTDGHFLPYIIRSTFGSLKNVAQTLNRVWRRNPQRGTEVTGHGVKRPEAESLSVLVNQYLQENVHILLDEYQSVKTGVHISSPVTLWQGRLLHINDGANAQWKK